MPVHGVMVYRKHHFLCAMEKYSPDEILKKLAFTEKGGMISNVSQHSVDVSANKWKKLQ